MLNPDILQIFELYKKYQVQTSFNTNLSFVSEEILCAIRDNCVSIHVTCDGSNEEQYENISQGLSYLAYKSNLKKISNICADTEKVMEVVLMRQNIRNVEQFVRFAYDNGYNKVIFNALGCNEWIKNEEDDLHNYASTAVYYCRIAKETGQKLGIHVITPFDNTQSIGNDVLDINGSHPFIEDLDLLHEKYLWYTNTVVFEGINSNDILGINPFEITYKYDGICEYAFAKFYIDLNGRVSFCRPASRKIVDIVSNEKSVAEVRTGIGYQKLRETFYCGELLKLCAGCYFIRNNSLKFLSVNQKR